MKIDDKILSCLVKCAKKALKNDEIPVSAVIIDKKGKIVSYAFNNRQKKHNILGHAEINAIVKAEKMIGDWRLNGYTMYVTLEPCNMCSAIILESRIDKVYYFLGKENGSSNNNFFINKSQVDGYESYKEIFNKLLTQFFDNKR